MMNRKPQYLQLQPPRRFVEIDPGHADVRAHDGNRADPGKCFLEDLESLGREILATRNETRKVPLRPGKASHQPFHHWIARDHEDGRDCRSDQTSRRCARRSAEVARMTSTFAAPNSAASTGQGARAAHRQTCAAIADCGPPLAMALQSFDKLPVQRLAIGCLDRAPDSPRAHSPSAPRSPGARRPPAAMPAAIRRRRFTLSR